MTAALVLQATVRVVEEARLTTLMVTHNMRHAIDLGDRLVMMDRGRVRLSLSRGESRAYGRGSRGSLPREGRPRAARELTHGHHPQLRRSHPRHLGAEPDLRLRRARRDDPVPFAQLPRSFLRRHLPARRLHLRHAAGDRIWAARRDGGGRRRRLRLRLRRRHDCAEVPHLVAARRHHRHHHALQRQSAGDGAFQHRALHL